MADKQTALSIVIRTVDKATAKLNAITKRIETINKPYKDLGEAFDKLADKSGFNAVMDGFKGVGSAVGDVIGRVAVVGGVVGLAVAGVMSLVDHFDKLGDTAERLGTSADFLAAFRYSAERAGAPIEGVDEALQTLVTNMGQAKTGTGRMLKFLNQVSPVLAKQIVAANSMEEALGLLADAEAKVPDAARRGALAMKTLGNAALAPLLARGSKGVQELLTQFHDLAGDLGDATAAAGTTDDALKNMHAASEGVKAALVKGLAPALTVIINKLTAWFVSHRADVELWAKQIGDELPGAVEKVVAKVSEAIDWTTKFVDKIGGMKTVAIAAALIITGPLISALVTLSATLITTVLPAIIAFSAALLASPAGPFVVALAAITVAAVALDGTIKDTKSDIDKLIESYEKMETESQAVKRSIKQVNDEFLNLSFLNTMKAVRAPFAPVEPAAVSAPAPTLSAASFSAAYREQRLVVDFRNAPPGMRATADPRNTDAIDLSVGHNMFGAP